MKLKSKLKFVREELRCIADFFGITLVSSTKKGNVPMGTFFQHPRHIVIFVHKNKNELELMQTFFHELGHFIRHEDGRERNGPEWIRDAMDLWKVARVKLDDEYETDKDGRILMDLFTNKTYKYENGYHKDQDPENLLTLLNDEIDCLIEQLGDFQRKSSKGVKLMSKNAWLNTKADWKDISTIS